METKEMKIVVPEGYEIDKENSTFECIKFKPKNFTYESIVEHLFKDKSCYFIGYRGDIKCVGANNYVCTDSNNAISKKQLEKLLAINKLMNVAKYLNGDWKPDWYDRRDYKFYLGIEEEGIYIDETNTCNEGQVCFKCLELAQQAIDILGEDTIRLALSTDW